jgi:uroporphyrinogen-III synthase
MRVWVTRALPEAQRTAERLIEAGHEPMLSPLLRVHVLPAAAALAKALDGSAALAFTSANGVRAFIALRPEADRALPVFAVGAATAAAARAAGFGAVTAGQGDVAALAALIAAQDPPLTGPLMHLSALTPAGDLVGDLNAQRLNARAVAVYDTVPCALSAEAEQALDQHPPGLDAVLIYSPKAAAHLVRLLEERPATEALTAICISKAATAPIRGLPFAALLTAKVPTETAMFACLKP